MITPVILAFCLTVMGVIITRGARSPAAANAGMAVFLLSFFVWGGVLIACAFRSISP